ncbi:hypothetical protein [Vreelandella azerica]|uniref:hypothetical protein n=1 Tax=Vreelandella azerica TaxID=2732867 RepID=UPI001C11584D|nr:hypothetical protein [Halomonas azerica]
MDAHVVDAEATQDFINQWKGSDGNERANFQPFMRDLCDLLNVPRPDPAKRIMSKTLTFLSVLLLLSELIPRQTSAILTSIGVVVLCSKVSRPAELWKLKASKML